MKPINIHEKLGKFDKQWHPHQVATVDDMQVLLAKVSGEFVWHSHKDEDELFFVQKGVLEMRFRESGNSDKEWSETVHQGEIIVVPKGVEHCPTTKDGEEVHLLLFEKLSTAHTGEVIDAKTQTDYPKI
ncbi:MAG: cupin domain-containing protein [Dokdonia donghaensis]|jgi:mannose-6-phosphate isomerase-like protein (cupin superfamily)|uniref:Cupin 2 conserved barrel domain protein n=1 Tax=uncultured Dokdonia sp. TaxID=575653 RepID=H6RGU7_9FLAO|nr:mannose-6-phosphate isomerase [uncultured bacterium]MDE0598504.1 cupin domain-containing protein [Dokdonia donghaensis]CCG00258.1 cupin 2 conserved barrel domain protein [uncultured Dokdonia sp.]